MATALSASQMDTAPGHPTNQVCMDKPSWHQPAVVAKHPTIPRLSCQLKDGFRSVMPVVNLMFQEPIKIDTESFKPPHNPLPENHLQKQTQQQP